MLMVEVLQLLPPRCPVGSLVASLAPVPVMGFFATLRFHLSPRAMGELGELLQDQGRGGGFDILI